MDAIHELRLLDDDTQITLFECAGTQEDVEDIITKQKNAHETFLTKPVGDRVLVFAHQTPHPVLERLGALRNEWPIVIDWPVTFQADAKACLSLVGERTTIRELVEAFPETVDIQVDRTGEFQFASDRILDTLTDREREVFLKACVAGYYENPREATYENLADCLECSAGTVGNHLRNVERKIMQSLTNKATEDTPPGG